MPCPIGEPSRFVRDGIVRRITVWAQGRGADVDAIAVNVELRPGSCVLQVVLIVVLCQPRPFNIPAEHSVGVILPETFPPMLLWIQVEQLESLFRRAEPEFLIEPLRSNGELI